MEVVITGASGYLGQHLTAELAGRGEGVRAVVRTKSPAADLAVLKDLGARVYAGQLAADDSGSPLAEAFAGADCAVHLIGSVAPPKGGPGIKELHLAYTTYFAQACVKAGIKKAVLVTALGADEKSSSQYLASKKMAETAFIECLESAGAACAVIRPSLIVGRQVGSRDSKLVERYRTILNTRPVVPLVGGGGNMLEPVFVGDLACAIAETLAKMPIYKSGGPRERIPAQIIEIGGPQKLSMKQFVEALAASMAISKPMITMPFAVAALAAGILGRLQDVPLLSPDQVKLAAEDMVCQVNALPQLLSPRLPMTLNQALLTYQTGSGR